jgi:hypothetical protein
MADTKQPGGAREACDHDLAPMCDTGVIAQDTGFQLSVVDHIQLHTCECCIRVASRRMTLSWRA